MIYKLVKSVVFLFCSLCTFILKAQPTIIEPGHESIKAALLFTGKFTWGTNSKDELNLISIQRNNKEITIEKRVTKKGIEESKQVLILNATTLNLEKENFTNEDRSYSLQFTAKVKGTKTLYETNKKEVIDEAFEGKHFNTAALPFIVSTLPITLDYRVTFSVMKLNGSWKPIYLRYKITDVSEQKSFSCISGIQDVWKITLNEKTKSHQIVIFFDKKTRRIFRIEQSFDGIHLKDNQVIYADKELDVNPIKASFNFSETMAMLKEGTSSIQGQASTKIANKRIIGNKTQYAPKGSLLTLIPNTPYFKEWVNYNLFIGNVSRPVYFDGKLAEGCSYPLPPDVAKTMRVTDVIDNKGNFVFDNLKPGEYLVYIGFVANKYTHTTRTPTGDYSITVNSDGTGGSATQIIDVKNWMTPQNVINHQFVKIKNDGETVKVKLND